MERSDDDPKGEIELSVAKQQLSQKDDPQGKAKPHQSSKKVGGVFFIDK